MKMKQLIERALASSYSYQEYRDLIKLLVQAGKTTGPVQSESFVAYTKLNAARMKRWDKTYNPTLNIQRVANERNKSETWLVLTEAWCGDAAHNVPVLARIAALQPKINFRLALRDENIELMDLFLTGNGRSIPKLICLDDNLNVIDSWGPRPAILQERVFAEKQSPTMPKEEFSKWMHGWYNGDKGRTVESEILELMQPVLAK